MSDLFVSAAREILRVSAEVDRIAVLKRKLPKDSPFHASYQERLDKARDALNALEPMVGLDQSIFN